MRKTLRRMIEEAVAEGFAQGLRGPEPRMPTRKTTPRNADSRAIRQGSKKIALEASLS